MPQYEVFETLPHSAQRAFYKEGRGHSNKTEYIVNPNWELFSMTV